jgi:hypothetical protein
MHSFMSFTSARLKICRLSWHLYSRRYLCLYRPVSGLPTIHERLAKGVDCHICVKPLTDGGDGRKSRRDFERNASKTQHAFAESHLPIAVNLSKPTPEPRGKQA